MTLVTRDDARLVSDIEKLIKKKIEIEPFELEDDRPRRAPRDDAGWAEREAAQAIGRAAVRPPRRATAVAHSDPFFDKPYEPAGSGAAAWETTAKAVAVVPGKALSPNIRPKKKVASLLGGGA